MKEPKMCPNCNSFILRRKKGCCPICDVKLSIDVKTKQFVREVDRVNNDKLLSEFMRLALDNGIRMYFPMMSKPYFEQLHYCRVIVNKCQEYIRGAKLGKHFNANDLAHEYVEQAMHDDFVLKIVRERLSIVVLSGDIFYRKIGSVIEILKARRREQIAQVHASIGFSVESQFAG